MPAAETPFIAVNPAVCEGVDAVETALTGTVNPAPRPSRDGAGSRSGLSIEA